MNRRGFLTLAAAGAATAAMVPTELLRSIFAEPDPYAYSASFDAALCETGWFDVPHLYGEPQLPLAVGYDFALGVDATGLAIYHAGYVIPAGTVGADDVLSVRYDRGLVKYFRNDELLFSGEDRHA